MKRKRICLITSNTEAIRGQRITQGIFAQCEKYDYDVCVFATTNTLLYYTQSYTIGEMNIYNLINYEHFDGVIVDTITIARHNDGETARTIFDRIKKECKAPVVSLGQEYEDYKTFMNMNDDILREMCRHMVIEHGYKNIAILTGFDGNTEAERRLEIFLDELSKLGVTVSDEHIAYGDFWYTGGEVLADRIISGEISRPEAVICASDHMGLGLIQRLTANGVRVPEDVAVIGFEGNSISMLGDIPLTSYESNDAGSAAAAVDYIRSVLEPDKPVIPYQQDRSGMIHRGASCGCGTDLSLISKTFRESLYHTERNYTADVMQDSVDIGLLMENYVSEQLTSSETPQRCMENIFGNLYLLRPYVSFYLCLRENWLDISADTVNGYSDRTVITTANFGDDDSGFSDAKGRVAFDTSLMLPQLFDEREKPGVFYFSAVHFNERSLGYAVLHRDLDDKHLINLVYRNWLRLVNNSLEMIRVKDIYMNISVRDEMTGLFNRRGMYVEYERMLSKAKEGDSLLACVIDMDGLKYINDTFGHNEGDFGITAVSSAALEIKQSNEICVRAGGDEFYIIGIGNYPDGYADEITAHFAEIMKRKDERSGKPFMLSASLGCAVRKIDDNTDLDDILSEADKIMYASKVSRRKNRK